MQIAQPIFFTIYKTEKSVILGFKSAYKLYLFTSSLIQQCVAYLKALFSSDNMGRPFVSRDPHRPGYVLDTWTGPLVSLSIHV